MRSIFYPIYDEENLLNRVYSVAAKLGILMSMDMDFRSFIYISNKLEEDMRQKAQKTHK